MSNPNSQFKKFSAAVVQIEDVLTTMLEGQNDRPSAEYDPFKASYEKYLIAKISESMTMLFQKDLYSERHWQNLSAFVNVGLLESAAPAQEDMPKDIQPDE